MAVVTAIREESAPVSNTTFHIIQPSWQGEGARTGAKMGGDGSAVYAPATSASSAAAPCVFALSGGQFIPRSMGYGLSAKLNVASDVQLYLHRFPKETFPLMSYMYSYYYTRGCVTWWFILNCWHAKRAGSLECTARSHVFSYTS